MVSTSAADLFLTICLNPRMSKNVTMALRYCSGAALLPSSRVDLVMNPSNHALTVASDRDTGGPSAPGSSLGGAAARPRKRSDRIDVAAAHYSATSTDSTE